MISLSGKQAEIVLTLYSSTIIMVVKYYITLWIDLAASSETDLLKLLRFSH